MVIKNVSAAPTQLKLLAGKEGDTITEEVVMVETFGAEKVEIEPVPDAAKPMDVLELVQLKIVVFPEKFIAGTAEPPQIFISGFGLIVPFG
jgi:hypothetical protein